jgi:hypothetical protein
MTGQATQHRPRSDVATVGRLQYAALVATVVIVGVVGAWSYFWPQAYFDRFPVVLGAWVSQDGLYNEHLVRDHGAMYLALGVATAYALVRPTPMACRLLGIAWTVFGVLHFGYHVTHLGHLSTSDAVSQVVVLAVALLIALAMVVPARASEQPPAG